MAQATDYDLANQSGAAFRSELNSVLAAIASDNSGAAAPATMYANMRWVDVTLSLRKKRNNANSAWITRGPMDDVDYDTMPVNSQSAGYTAVAADRGKLIDFTAAATLALTAAATLGAGWFCAVRDSHASGSVTTDPNGAETIDGAATVVLTAGQSCFVVCDGAAFKTVGRQPNFAENIFNRGYIFGCTLSNNGADATNDIDIAAGIAASDATPWRMMELAAGITKRLDAAWAVGNANGGLDTGSIANTTYHMFLIRRSDTGVVDVLFSASATAPTMPTNYDQKRRIGSVLRVAAALVAFVQDGDYFRRKASILDVAAANPGIAAVTRTLSVPTGINVFAEFNGGINTTSSAVDASVHFSDLAANDEAPSRTAAPLAGALANNSAGGLTVAYAQHRIRTNTSAQIRSRLIGSDANVTLNIATLGWYDRRGQDA